MKKEMFIQLIGIFLLVGCTPQIVYVPIKRELLLKKAAEVQLFLHEPKVSYQILGGVEVKGGWSSKEKMIAELKRKAWLVGADAVIDVEYRRGGEKAKKARLGQYAQSHLLWDLPQRKINNLFGEVVLRGEAVKFTNSNSTREGSKK